MPLPIYCTGAWSHCGSGGEGCGCPLSNPPIDSVRVSGFQVKSNKKLGEDRAPGFTSIESKGSLDGAARKLGGNVSRKPPQEEGPPPQRGPYALDSGVDVISAGQCWLRVSKKHLQVQLYREIFKTPAFSFFFF